MSFVIEAGTSVADEVRRIAGEEIGKAVAILEAGRRRRDRGVHETRKRVKKLRGLFKLVRALDPDLLKSEEERYRDLSRGLSAGRDATALVESFERFEREFPRRFEAGVLDPLKLRLVERRDRIIREEKTLDAAIDDAIRAFGDARQMLAGLRGPVKPDTEAEIVAKGLAKTWRKARMARKAAGKGKEPEAFHDLRKATKAHFMHLTLLEPYWPKPYKPRRDGIKRLGDQLGELNDIDLMRDWLAGEADIDPVLCETFLAVLSRKEKALQRLCLDGARTCFRALPEATAAKVAKAYAAARTVAARTESRQLMAAE